MSADERPWTENDQHGPEISEERCGILSFIDGKIAALRRKAKGLLDGESTNYGAHLLEALRSDLRQELDREDLA